VPTPDQESLADRRHLVVVLRLVTATTGQLLYGEVIDAHTGSTGRFIGWRGMTSAVRSWLVDELGRPAAPEPGASGQSPEMPVER
jgi:hypothetical protein